MSGASPISRAWRPSWPVDEDPLPVNTLFLTATTFYFESLEEDEPLHRGYSKDTWDREQLLDRPSKKLAVIGTAKKLLNSRSERVYLREMGNSRLEIDPEKVEVPQHLDGWHGVLTNFPDSDALVVMEQVHGLWQMEAAFRVCKRDLQVRPIFHWTRKRIHVAIAFMTLMYACHPQRKLHLRGKT